MPDIFDYLAWRGDLTLRHAPFNGVDALILTTMSYIHFGELLPKGLDGAVELGTACRAFLELPEQERRLRVRCKRDQDLAKALIDRPRFAGLKLAFHQEKLDLETETQFAALAVLLEDGDAFVCFRGTDNTLVGWKEDFNMSFQEVVPAQRLALDYLTRFLTEFPGRASVGGHSKGGNLAVYSAASIPPILRDRIDAVYNNDGPGFWQSFLDSPGYDELLPRISTWVPQSSVIGMLLEHEEPYTVVRSRQIGILQHDPYSWQVLGPDFVRVDEVSSGSRLTDQALKNWLKALPPQQRETFVDAVFELFKDNDLKHLDQMRNPKSFYAVLKSLSREDEATREMMAHTLGALVKAAKEVVLAPGKERPVEALRN